MTPEAGLWNVANILTIVRIVLVPVFIGFLLAGGTVWRLAALGTFCVASLTDLLDGRLARSRSRTWLARSRAASPADDPDPTTTILPPLALNLHRPAADSERPGGERWSRTAWST